jgi:hypothetical protein
MNDKELVSFGNYLLSDERNKYIREDVRNTVHHSDLENWKGSVVKAKRTCSGCGDELFRNITCTNQLCDKNE